MARPVVALLTDFGTTDPFVGVMKGVLLGRCPDAAIVDLSHDVPAQGVAEGAFLLERCFRHFPAATVFVAVVDPGVGTSRLAVAARAHGRVFVGPDNGLLAEAVSLDANAVVRVIDVKGLGLPEPSRTFHGRDVFAKVAGDLAAGTLRVEDVGPELPVLVPSDRRVPLRHGDRIHGAVVTVDRFGNLITNVDVATLETLFRPVVEIGDLSLPLHGTYGDVPEGEFVALVNAYELLEVARRNGDASRATGLGRGARVVVRRG
ncbi:MAG TPA: SAM-dependent chlorinase/fluorinase [Polyangiaceae bacterium]|nr:SAM-dependent chlorinase/fluorinase [Polyangiaceae bacterium]